MFEFENHVCGFFNEYRYLSNFHVCNIWYGGLLFKSSEAAYMSCKTTDLSLKIKFANFNKPKDAKALGNKIELRPNWNDMRVYYMIDVLFAKFIQNDDIRMKLLATGDAYLEERNWWNDEFWGTTAENQGLNMLGKSLMLVRNRIKDTKCLHFRDQLLENNLF